MNLAKIIAQSTMAMDLETVERNIRQNLARGLPELHKHHSWKKFKGEYPLAIVGGGPSLADTIEELRTFRHMIVCGSAHDHIVSQGIEPEFCAVLDPDPIAANYLRKPCETTTYLVSSNCDAAVFNALERYQVVLWHCAGSVSPELVAVENCIGGGCTVTLRAIGIALLMGYGNLHFFGFDSCNKGDQHHAYAAEEIDPPVDVYIPGSDQVFSCSPYHLAQAQQFQDALRDFGQYFTVKIHGHGLIAELMKVGAAQAKQLENAA